MSTTVIVCDRVAEWLPHASVASHLRVIVFEQELPDVVSPRKFTVAPLQASDAVGGLKLGVAVHSIVPFAPALPIVGGTSSITVIV